MERKSILLVDDRPDNLKLLTGVLQAQGYAVRPVTSGRLALTTCRVEKPDLILLDIKMPDMDGYEVCERLKEDAELKDIPVIFLTALMDTTDKMKAFELGGVDYITKPFQSGEVEARVRTHLTISDQRKKLQESYDKLRETEGLRDNLVHMIVHDIRNALSTVMGSFELLDLLLKEETGLEKGHRYIRTARQSVDKVVEMANSLLDISRMEAGELKVNVKACKVNDVIADVIDRVGSSENNKIISFEAPDDPVCAMCDSDMVSRIMLNLLHNALKFTSENGRIVAGIQEIDGMVRVFVRDNGPGIPSEFHSRIFEKFGRVELHGKRQQSSTGLGLAFCKLAAEAQGGTIGLKSEIGKGSEFWFTVPRGLPCDSLDLTG